MEKTKFALGDTVIIAVGHFRGKQGLITRLDAYCPELYHVVVGDMTLAYSWRELDVANP